MFDPALPATGSPLDSAVMRSQFNGLKALIDLINAINAAQVDGVTTVAPTDPATVQVSVVGNTLHFTFSIPMGQTGAQGQPGPQGGPGPEGSQGPPFAQAIVDAVNTLNPGDPASVTVTFDGINVHFTFGIPRGADGTPGPPGEVTQAALDTAIATTARNPSTVTPITTPAESSYSQAQTQTIIDKLNELLTATIRSA